MEKIVLKEDFDLVEVYNQLIESRGVIDGIDGIVLTITNYINNVLSSSDLRKKYYLTYVKEEDVKQYEFTIPSELFKNVDCLFMKKPIFHIHLFLMGNKYGDPERNLGETNFISRYYPNINIIGEDVKLYEPEFNLSFVVEDTDKIDMFVVADKISHELVHAKRFFFEFVRKSKYRDNVFKKNAATFDLISGKEKNKLEELVGNILYLTSDDEINARCNQLYYQLKRFSFLSRNNINQAIKRTKVYDFLILIEEKIQILDKMVKKRNYYEINYIDKILKNIYGVKNMKNDPYEFLENLLIVRKNYFIRQIDKVKERVLYEKMREPIIMS